MLCNLSVTISFLALLKGNIDSSRIAIGPHTGRKALTLYSVPPVEAAPNNPLLARMAGFSLHAATVCEAHQRSRLERLCRYVTRPPA
jgi:hypothetical protein